MVKKYFSSALSLIVVFGIVFLAGCSSSSDSSKGTITVCNTDDEEYIVELYRETDNTLVKKFSLDEWYNAVGDQCDDFSDVSTGRYYIVIYEENADNTDESEGFYLSADEHKYFTIASPGEITED